MRGKVCSANFMAHKFKQIILYINDNEKKYCIRSKKFYEEKKESVWETFIVLQPVDCWLLVGWVFMVQGPDIDIFH